MSERNYFIDDIPRSLFVRNNINTNERSITQTQPINMFLIKRAQTFSTNNNQRIQSNSLENQKFQSVNQIRRNECDRTKDGNIRTVPSIEDDVYFQLTYDNNNSFSKHSTQNMENNCNVQDIYNDKKLISQYFAEKKNINYEKRLQYGKESKLNLIDLQKKYDIFDMPRNLTKENETIKRSSYAEQIIHMNSGLKHKLSKLNEQIQKNKRTIQKRKKPETLKIEPKMIHLIGYVENILKWNNILKDIKITILYNVLGTFISIMDGIYIKEKFIFVRGNNGTVLECSFFEIDRSLPKIIKGQLVACFGKIIGAQRFRLYNIDILKETQFNDFQRAMFLSQRTISELLEHKSNS